MTETVLVNVSGASGSLVLNRPRALNSLNQEMVDTVREALHGWAEDDSVAQVVITSEHPKAFCAGGDVRAVRQEQLNGDFESGDTFFVDEYAMNHEIAQFPKPYVAVIDGIAMGGGLGVSLHGSHRIVTENASAAMPEMAIGFIPDVGISHMSQRAVTADGDASPAVARFLGLTGYRLSAADMLWAGWATHFVPSKDIEAFLSLIDASDLTTALTRYSQDSSQAGESQLSSLRPVIEQVFSHDSWEAIEDELDDLRETEKHCAPLQIIDDLLTAASPSSLVAGAELYRANAQDISLREGLDNEFRLGSFIRRTPDFSEGVRAVLEDKDRNAAFVPATTAEVDPAPFREQLHG